MTAGEVIRLVVSGLCILVFVGLLASGVKPNLGTLLIFAFGAFNFVQWLVQRVGQSTVDDEDEGQENRSASGRG